MIDFIDTWWPVIFWCFLAIGYILLVVETCLSPSEKFTSVVDIVVILISAIAFGWMFGWLALVNDSYISNRLLNLLNRDIL